MLGHQAMTQGRVQVHQGCTWVEISGVSGATAVLRKARACSMMAGRPLLLSSPGAPGAPRTTMSAACTASRVPEKQLLLTLRVCTLTLWNARDRVMDCRGDTVAWRTERGHSHAQYRRGATRVPRAGEGSIEKQP